MESGKEFTKLKIKFQTTKTLHPISATFTFWFSVTLRKFNLQRQVVKGLK